MGRVRACRERRDAVESALIGELESCASVDLVLGCGRYRGLTEWERIAGKLAPLLQGMAVEDVPAARLEWLAKRADVFPTQGGLR